MSVPGPQRARGRPLLPVDKRRTRKDYRFSPVALAHIEQGRLLVPGNPVLTETAFLEQAIAYYVAFLSGDVLPVPRETQKIEQLQTRVSELEHEVHTTAALLYQAQTELKTLKARHQEPVTPAQPMRQGVTQHRPSYQILIQHETAVCPTLPDGFCYREQSEDNQCPTHEVFSEVCSIGRARRALEQLKPVAGFTRIWLAKNGYALERDAWWKENGQWSKNEAYVQRRRDFGK